MFSHIFIGVTDFDRARAFYSALMSCLGLEERFCDGSRPWAGWQKKGEPRPLLLIGKPFDEETLFAAAGVIEKSAAMDFSPNKWW